ncbi:mucin-2-like [Macrosteles quadrilineatus]|uniref:mucin-2-like n=1 Tax=Macrosteles quadrilineatus TaxID=74068 RepID=UPI0023E28E69|nr:mucin-2-like [Macrosteles quadrilineatus]
MPGTILVVCLILSVTLTNANYPKRLSDPETDLPVQEYEKHNGDVVDYKILLGGNIERPPYILALFVESSVVYDEFQCHVTSEEEVEQLRVNQRDGVFASVLPTENYAVLCKKNEPGSMMVIKDGECRRRKYNQNDLRLAPSEEVVTGLKCCEAAREIASLIPGRHIELMVHDSTVHICVEKVDSIHLHDIRESSVKPTTADLATSASTPPTDITTAPAPHTDITTAPAPPTDITTKTNPPTAVPAPPTDRTTAPAPPIASPAPSTDRTTAPAIPKATTTEPALPTATVTAPAPPPDITSEPTPPLAVPAPPTDGTTAPAMPKATTTEPDPPEATVTAPAPPPDITTEPTPPLAVPVPPTDGTTAPAMPKATTTEPDPPEATVTASAPHPDITTEPTTPTTEPAPATATPKKSKVAAGKKQPNKTTHPPISDMVHAAIDNLNTRGGSSLRVIKTYIAQNYKVYINEKVSSSIRDYLNSAVTAGTLERRKIFDNFRYSVKKPANTPTTTKPNGENKPKVNADNKTTKKASPATNAPEEDYGLATSTSVERKFTPWLPPVQWPPLHPALLPLWCFAPAKK